MFFCRLSELGEKDPWEGYWTQFQFAPEYLAEIAKNFALKDAPPEEAVKNWIARQCHKNAVSCWSIGERENHALWKIYAPVNGVAIKSTFERLKRAFPGRSLYAGKVKYIDYATATMPIDNGYWPTVHKRLPFAYESELRMVVSDNRALIGSLEQVITADQLPGFTDANGDHIAANLSILIEEVVVGPLEPNWFVDVVRDAVSKFGVSVPVRKSTIFEPPV